MAKYLPFANHNPIKDITSMTHMIPVSPKTHQHRFWHRYSSYQFVQKEQVAPLVAAEISKAVQAMPLAFIKQNNVFMLVGVLSQVPKKNLFVSPEGKWLGSYVPSCFRGYPFFLTRMNGKEDKMMLCVDEDSGLMSESDGEPFFVAENELAQPVKDILNFLTQVHQNRRATDAAVASLASAGLMTPWAVNGPKDRNISTETGLYKVDEAKLNTLEDDVFLKLRKSQSLPIAYAQLLSMENINVLARNAEHKAAPTAGRKMPDDLNTVVQDDDMIRFD